MGRLKWAENIWVTARWAPTSYKWSYNLYKWPYNWVTGVITPISGLITILITGRGPTLWDYFTIFKGPHDSIYNWLGPTLLRGGKKLESREMIYLEDHPIYRPWNGHEWKGSHVAWFLGDLLIMVIKFINHLLAMATLRSPAKKLSF